MDPKTKPEPQEGQIWTARGNREAGHSVKIIGRRANKWIVESQSTKREYLMFTQTLHAKFRLVPPGAEPPKPVELEPIGAPGL